MKQQDIEIICPNCGSTEVSKPQYSKKAIALTILLLGFPIAFISKTYHCFQCYADFKIKNNSADEKH